ncbi:hypothetical protein ACU8KI_16115 [Rhizobium leguminosarum]
MEIERIKRHMSLGVNVLARLLAMSLFLLFAFLLWQTIAIGTANSGFQRITLQIETLEKSLSTLEDARRQAELRTIRMDNGVASKDDGTISSIEAQRVLINAASDYGNQALQLFAAMCDAGTRLSQMGTLPDSFIVATDDLKDCPKLISNLGPDEVAKTSDPTTHFQEVRVVLAQYGVLANGYMLPILFGMLGALAYALRDMVVTPQNMGRLPIVTGYVLRVLLGAIFGLIIGYVNFGTAGSSLAASPLLFSLVAGFSTDAVVSLLDRIAYAITYERKTDDHRASPIPPGPAGA